MIKKTDGTLVCMDYSVCDNIFSRAKGLMFSKPKDLLFVMPRFSRVSLHMWFVFYPIDVAFLDGKKRVVEVKKGFKPFSLYKSKRPARYFLEGKDLDLRVGDELVF